MTGQCPTCGHALVRDPAVYDHEAGLVCAVLDQTGDCPCATCCADEHDDTLAVVA